MQTPIATIGDKCVIGALDMSFLSATSKIFPGTLVANGPVYFGMAISPGIPTATVMIGPPIGIGAPLSLRCDGIANFHGIVNVIAVSNFTGLCTKFGATIRNALSQTSGINIKNALNLGNAKSQFNANVNVAGLVTIAGALKVAGTISSPTITMLSARIASKKGFDIPHPTKAGHRIRHVCPEGPESAVYIRGILKDNNTIELPDYWKGLIDYDSITVQLQPIGDRHFHLNVMEIDEEKVVVKEADDKPINCFYHIWANRMGEELTVEYEGLTPKDYPGDNKEYNINGL